MRMRVSLRFALWREKQIPRAPAACRDDRGTAGLRRAICFSAALLAMTGAAACAQNTKSQLGTVSQVVAGTKIDVTYRRPVARGRDLFGALVPWGRIWT